jgi:thiosulfate/3-mercaptopyruvate sulfurtransferase
MYSTLISAQDLQKLMAERKDNIVVFDCRHRLDNPEAGYQMYLESHIPGALFAHLDKDLAGPIEMRADGHTGRHPLPAPETWMKRLGEWGVTPTTQVVAYDDQGGMTSARMWWMLRAVGHMAVAVLDGGWQAWLASGGAVQSGEVKPKHIAPPYPGIFRAEWVATLDEIKSQIANSYPEPAEGRQSQILLVDARTPARYRGEVEPYGPIAGHIPGARNAFYQDNLNPDGTFRSPAELRQRFAPIVEAAQGKEVVMYCGSGVSACHNLLAMEIAGLPTAKLFPNSWSGWSATPGLPIAKSEEN